MASEALAAADGPAATEFVAKRSRQGGRSSCPEFGSKVTWGLIKRAAGRPSLPDHRGPATRMGRGWRRSDAARRRVLVAPDRRAIPGGTSRRWQNAAPARVPALSLGAFGEVPASQPAVHAPEIGRLILASPTVAQGGRNHENRVRNVLS